MTNTTGAAEAGPSTGPHRMRITSAGSIKGYVAFALDFLKDHPDRPLILHSLPTPNTTPAKPTLDASRTLRPCTLVTPRLITVAEIIKRELILSYEKEGRGKGKHKAVGVWQYTETALVPAELLEGAPPKDREEGQEGEAKAGELERVLGGKTRPKMTHHPFFQITLSTQPLGLEKKHDPDGNGGYTFVTRQHITIPRRRKHSEQRRARASGAIGDVAMEGDLGVENRSAEVAELGEVISRPLGQSSTATRVDPSDIGAPIPRPTAVASTPKPGKQVPATAAGETQRSTSLLAKQTTQVDGLEEEEKDSAATAGPSKAGLESDKPKNSSTGKDKDSAEAKEKKRRRQASNAIDAEFAMFGKSTKKKKPSKP